MSREIDALLYDFGGVVAHIDFDRILQRWAVLAGVPVEELRPRFTHGEAYQRHERSEIGMAEYCGALRRELGIDLTDAKFVDGWQEVFGPEIDETVALIRRLAGRVPQYLFSNTNATHYDYWSVRYAQALKPLRRQFISCRMGKRKPERAAFEEVAREIGVPLERILFLDDTVANIEGAEAAGVQAALVRTPADVRAALAPWLQ